MPGVHAIGIFKRHVHATRYRGRSESEFRVHELNAAIWASQCDVERFTAEFIDQRPAAATQDTRDVSRCRSLLEIGLEFDGQKQGVEKVLAHGPIDGEDIAQGGARLTRDDRLERHPLGFGRPLINDDLARAVARRDFSRPFPKPSPPQASQRRLIEVAFLYGADVGRLTKAMRTGQVELTTTVHVAIAVVVGTALELPLVGHLRGPFGVAALSERKPPRVAHYE